MTVQVNQDPACCSWRASFLCWVCSTITERSTQPLSRRAVEISLSLGYLFSDCLTQIAKVIKCSTWEIIRHDAEIVILHIKCSTFEKLSIKVFLCCGNVQQTSAENSCQVHQLPQPVIKQHFFFFLKGRRQEKERQVRISIWWMAVELCRQAQRHESAIRKYHHSCLFWLLALVTDGIPVLHQQ